MDFKNFFYLFTEKKEHIINRLQNLTDEQKKEIIDFFNKKPNLEGKVDWNNKNLTYADFEPIIKERSKTEVKKAVSKSGIAGLVEGEDYVELPLNVSGKTPVNAYMPLNYNASRLIASDKIGGCEGKWCTAYQKTNEYWNTYTGSHGVVLVYFIMGDNNKYALAIYPNNTTAEVFDQDDSSVNYHRFFEILEDKTVGYGVLHAESQVMKQTKLFDKVREYIKTHRPIETLTEEDIERLANDCIRRMFRYTYRHNISEKSFTIAKNKIHEQYNKLKTWIEKEKPTVMSIRAKINDETHGWINTYKKILQYVGTEYDLVENSLNNKNNALLFCDKGVDLDAYKDQILKLKWSTKQPKSYGTLTSSYEEMMRYWFNELKIHSFDAIPVEWFTKWLTYNYKNNHRQFEICKENFVEDFSSAEYFNTGARVRDYLKVKIYSSILGDKEKEYLNSIISKVETSGYSKNKQQTTLKL